MWDSLLQPIIPQTGACACPTSAMDWGCVVEVLQNILNLAITFGTLMVIFFIMYAAVMMIANPNSPSARLKARNRLLNAVVGLFVMLTGWLVVDYIMKVLYNPDTADFGPWNEILAPRGDDMCIKETKQGILTTGIFEAIGDVINPGTGGSSSGGGGACRVVTQGACSVAIMERSCFGNRAAQASQICFVEGLGRADIESKSDRLNGGSGPSYSVGLWQINLTAHPVAGLNCPAAFDKRCGAEGTLIGPTRPGACRSRIVNQDLYNKCVAAAKNPQNNTEVACRLYREAGSSFKPWAYTANKCSIPQRI